MVSLRFHCVRFLRPGRDTPRWQSTVLACVTLVALSIAGGCGTGHGFSYDGDPGQAEQATLVAWAPAVEAIIVPPSDASPIQGLFLLDTGSPVSAVDLGFLASQGLDTGIGSDPRLLSGYEIDAFGLHFFNRRLVAAALFSPSQPLDGIIGADILDHFCLALDDQAHTVTLARTSDDVAAASPVADSRSVSLEVAGGGIMILPGDVRLSVPATRLLVDVMVEGRTVTAVVDTGASAVLLGPDLAKDLMTDDPTRPRLDGLEVDTADGLADASMIRVASLSVGTSVAHSLPCMVVQDAVAFQSLEAELGRPVSLLLGDTFLREFFVALDIPRQTMLLARYQSMTHLDPREFVFVGLSLRASGNEVVVDHVYPGKDAEAKGVRSGDVVMAIDDNTVTSVERAMDLVRAHDVGQTAAFRFERNRATFNADLLVEDLLPAYPAQKSTPNRGDLDADAHDGGSLWWQQHRLGGLVNVLGPFGLPPLVRSGSARP